MRSTREGTKKSVVGEVCAIVEVSLWKIQTVRLPMDMSVSTVGSPAFSGLSPLHNRGLVVAMVATVSTVAGNRGTKTAQCLGTRTRVNVFLHFWHLGCSVGG